MSDGGLLGSLFHNQVFMGMASGVVFSSLLFQIRKMPRSIWAWLHKKLSVTLVIDSNEDLFDRLSIYLSTSPYVARARWLRMVELYDFVEQRWKWKACFGLGWHLFRDQGTWFLLHRHIEDEGKGLVPARRETITIRTFGPSQTGIRNIMARAEAVYERQDTVRVHVWHKGAYILADHKLARTLDTVFIPEDQKERIKADLFRYLGARDLYRQRGTPWRRGYLLEGPPGTGKSTLTFVIACLAKRPIYVINLNTAGGDTGLMAAFNSAEVGSIVVIEDIDSATITHDRALNVSEQVQIKPDEMVTLAGLLNAVDGLASRENRILVVTSNHADKLDPALLRPGRIDHRETIGLIAETEARQMAEAFLGSGVSEWFDRNVLPRLPMSPAALQGTLLIEVEQNTRSFAAVPDAR